MTDVLVIDDAATVRSYHRAVLERAGLSVDEATNGYEALERALRRPYPIYICDVVMPQMDGYTFTRALRAERSGRDARVVLVSSQGSPRARELGLGAGAALYLVKPVPADTLLAHVRLLLGRAA